MKQILNVLSLSLVMSVLVFSSFIGLEPGIAGAVSDSVTVTQTVASGISISTPADVTMTTLTTSQLTGVGTSTWTVITNNQAGYTLGLKADYTGRTTALKDTATGEQFTDYGTSSPAAWSVSNDYMFGFSALGNHTTGFGSGSLCESSADVPSTTLNYVGFYSADRQIASSSSETNQAGTATTVCLATQQDTVWAPSGTYTATAIATATAN